MAEGRRLTFSFRVDPELARDRDAFHFDVLLAKEETAAERGFSARQTPALGRSLSAGAAEWARAGSIVEFCLPPDGNVAQDVRDLGSGLGSICVLGHGTVSGGDPALVKGKIYGSTVGIPATPPVGAMDGQLVNLGSPYPNYDPPPEFDCSSVNFVFHKNYRGELPGAQHSATAPYDQNVVAVWVSDGATWVLGTQPFKGKTAVTSECGDGASSFSPAVGSQPLKVKGPARYAMTADETFPLVVEPVVLRRGELEFNASEFVWKSCRQQCPEADWELWVRLHAGQPYARLVLRSVYGSRLEAPIVWQSNRWDFDGPNRITRIGPGASADGRLTITVTPI